MALKNPTANDRVYENITYSVDKPMTIAGTVNKTALLLLLVVVSATYTWSLVMRGAGELDAIGSNSMPWLVGGLIVGLVLGIATCFKPTWAPFTAPIYALAEGLVIGAISAIFQAKYQGIVLQAAVLTFGVAFTALVLYRTGVVKVTSRFINVVIAATVGVLVAKLIALGAGFFMGSIPVLNDATPLGIGVSLVIVAVAALNLFVDYDFIDRGVAAGAPKYLEWYGAFTLTVTLIWLYIEILRLLSKLQRR